MRTRLYTIFGSTNDVELGWVSANNAIQAIKEFCLVTYPSDHKARVITAIAEDKNNIVSIPSCSLGLF